MRLHPTTLSHLARIKSKWVCAVIAGGWTWIKLVHWLCYTQPKIVLLKHFSTNYRISNIFCVITYILSFLTQYNCTMFDISCEMLGYNTGHITIIISIVRLFVYIRRGKQQLTLTNGYFVTQTFIHKVQKWWICCNVLINNATAQYSVRCRVHDVIITIMWCIYIQDIRIYKSDAQ
jgi:hypothetical protein